MSPLAIGEAFTGRVTAAMALSSAFVVTNSVRLRRSGASRAAAVPWTWRRDQRPAGAATSQGAA